MIWFLAALLLAGCTAPTYYCLAIQKDEEHQPVIVCKPLPK